MHGGSGYVVQRGSSASLEISELLDLFGFVPNFGAHPATELTAKLLEIIGLPRQLFALLSISHNLWIGCHLAAVSGAVGGLCDRCASE